MKKTQLFGLMIASLILLGACGKEEKKPEENLPTDPYSMLTVSEKNTALLIKFTGSRCGPCGGWGWTAFEEMMSTSAGKAVFLHAYDQNFVSQLFITKTAEDWKKTLSLNSWPSFVGNHVLQTARVGQGIDVNQTKVNMADVANAHTNAPVIANTGLIYKTDGDSVTVTTKTKFFKDVSGEYLVGLYISEDKVVGAQSGHPKTPNVEHHFVLRQIDENWSSWGESISTGDVKAGADFKREIAFSVDPVWNKANLYMFTIIWKKVGSKYEFVNASPAVQPFK